jgi:D-hexose-6-phosphate mutarotase
MPQSAPWRGGVPLELRPALGQSVASLEKVPAMSITLSSPDLEAQVSPAGAELVRLRDEAGRDLLWDGNPAFWTGRSPLLFRSSAG